MYGNEGATQAGIAYDSGRNASRVPPPQAEPQQPRIIAMLDALEKNLQSCHEGHQRIHNATSRLLGAEPEHAEKDQRDVRPVASSIEQRISDLLHGTEVLGRKLYGTSERLDSAV